MKTAQTVLLVLLAAAIAGGVYLYTHRSREPVVVSAPIPVPSESPAPSPSVGIQFPIPGADESTTATASAAGGIHAQPSPLPSIDESDPGFLQTLDDLFGPGRFAQLFLVKDVIRRIVVTVDGAGGPKQIPEEHSALKPLGTEFVATAGAPGEQTIAASNYARYTPYVELLNGADTSKLVAAYIRFYPLFQAAYRELGTRGYFNDRVIAVIDQVLRTPDVQGPVKIRQPAPHYRYKFVDDRLETLSAVQKALIRMGNANAQLIKAKLRVIRTQLARGRRQGAG